MPAVFSMAGVTGSVVLKRRCWKSQLRSLADLGIHLLEPVVLSSDANDVVIEAVAGSDSAPAFRDSAEVLESMGWWVFAS